MFGKTSRSPALRCTYLHMPTPFVILNTCMTCSVSYSVECYCMLLPEQHARAIRNAVVIFIKTGSTKKSPVAYCQNAFGQIRTGDLSRVRRTN